VADPYAQADAGVRFEWGPVGAAAVPADVVVVVDVLRFSTTVERYVTAGVEVHPYRWRDDTAAAHALKIGAVLADGRRGRPSLSPVSVDQVGDAERVVLTSINGAMCTLAAADTGATVVAGCLRNASAVAAWAAAQRGSVTVLACGERWEDDDSLRPAIEDLLGAGAILSGLPGERSPEDELAVAAWHAADGRLTDLLERSSSGRELEAVGLQADTACALELDVSRTVPVLTAGAFVQAATGS
jgi:2-phosphosulfolactate phosphatase